MILYYTGVMRQIESDLELDLYPLNSLLESAVECTSILDHDCVVVASYKAQIGCSGAEIFWCDNRYRDHVLWLSQAISCAYCGLNPMPSEHWTILPV